MKKYYKASLIILLMTLFINPLWSVAISDDHQTNPPIHDLRFSSDAVISNLPYLHPYTNFAPDLDKEPAKDTIAHKPGHNRDVIEGYNGWAGNPDSLAVYIDDTWTAAKKDTIRAAMARWNNAGSVPKFKEVTKAADAKITITQGDPGEGNAGLFEWKTNADGKITGGTITIAEDTSPLSLMEVATHELGHSIGLDDTDQTANAGDVMKGSGPSNGSGGNLSKHDSTEMRQAGAAITALAEAPKERKRAISPEQAILPGQFSQLVFPLPDFYPFTMELIVEPIADDLCHVQYFFIDGNQLRVGLFTDPMHGSGKLYLDVSFITPDGIPVEFWGVHFINSNPVPHIEFSCPFEAIQSGDMVLVNWVDQCTYPSTNPLHSQLIVDGNTHYEVKPNGDYAIKLPPGLHQLHLIVDDYQINSADSFFDIYVTSTSVPWEEPFEDYPIGSDIVGQGGWEFWFGSTSSPGARVTNTEVHTGGQSLKVMGAEDPALADDILHQFTGCNSGVWKFSTWQFIPVGAAGGTTYLTLLDQYGNDIDECHWATQIKFDPDLGVVESDYDGATLPLVKGQWVGIDIIIDFDNDWQIISYNGQILTQKSWTLGVPQELPGILNLAAIDLFANTLANAPVYYDDFLITNEFENFPIIVCPPEITVSNNPGLCGAAGVDLGFPEIVNPDGTEVITNNAPDVFPVGVTTVVWIVTNSGGYTVSCDQMVTVLDEEPPFILPMPDLEAPNDPGLCGAALTWEWPTATDNCGIESLTGNYETGAIFPVGLTDVVYTATDVSGNQAYSGFTVVVLDVEEPELPEMPDLEAPNDPGQCGAALTWEWPVPEDNCGIESITGNYGPGMFFPVGLTDVVYTATDVSGNQAYAGFTVTVFDTDPPDVGCPGDMTVSQSSPPFTLSGATPEGGIYEGSGVSGGVFFPADAGVGTHQINYLYANPSSGCTYACSFLINVTGGAAQTIQIPQGWSGISSYIQPEPPLIDLVLSPIFDQLIMLYNFEGVFYPGQNVNTLGAWDAHQGYVIKVANDVLLTIDGNETPDKSVFVDEGWSIIPVLSNFAVFTESLLGGLDQLIIVKEVAGSGIFWPQFGINTLGFVEPGKSYFVLMDAPAWINFGTSSTKSHYDGKSDEIINSPWNAVTPGPASHVVAFSLAENVLQNGDIVGGFNTDGACTGLVQITDANAPFALSVFGNTEYARLSNGLETGEAISYRLYRPSTDEIFTLEVRYNEAMNTGHFETNGLSEVMSVKLAPVGISDLQPLKVSIYPNPSDGTFTVDGNGEQVELDIFNAFGEQVYASEAVLPHKVNLSDKPVGIYFIKITSTKGGYYGKVIIK